MVWTYLLCLLICVALVRGGSLSTTSNTMALLTTETFPTAQLTALQILYNSTNGPYWTWTTGPGIPWDFTVANPNPCTQQWQGINCSKVLVGASSYLDSVDSLVLAKNNMSGVLPNIFSAFTNLTTLNITQNVELSGSFPTSLCSLSRLQTINFVNNRLFGALPGCIDHITQLTTLILSNNVFDGVIPNNLCNLSKLYHVYMAQNRFTALPTCSLSASVSVLNVGYNRITGEIPTTLCDMSTLDTLGLANNSFVGRIPNCLNRMQTLRILHLSQNYLSGTIPSTMCQLQSLTSLYIDENHLVGHIPSCAWSNNLTTFKVSHNLLNGSLPSSLAALTNLLTFDASDNALTGSIPVGFYAQIVQLNNNGLGGSLPVSLFSNALTKVIALAANAFVGSIPDVAPANSQLYYLTLDDNQLHGRLPNTMCNMGKLVQFTVSENSLTGDIPACSSSLPTTTLALFNAANNLFEGSIPSWMCINKLPQIFYLSGNRFSGSLFPCFGQLHNNVTVMEASFNHFTGAVPFSAQTSRHLVFVDISNNALSQPLNGVIFGTNAVTMYLQENMITGSLPEVTVLPRPKSWHGYSFNGLFQLNVSNNFLHGSIPKSFYNLPDLQTLDLSGNQLTGSVNFTEWSRIGQLFLQQNTFSGTLSEFIQPPHNASISILDISDNEFTGTIPDSIFFLEDLATLVVGGNCFTGSIPESLCNGQSKALQLTALSFDGIATADKCVTKIFPGPLKAYTAHYPLFGSIPACLFTDYPLLEQIHFSGNKMGGSLPTPAFISPSLSNLVLSHNRITGTIPLIIQEYPWGKLDLSFNKLTGYLSDSMYSFAESNNTLKLSVNRLSGNIPHSIQDAASVDILSGNLFACPDGVDSLPENDPGTISYQCGSNSTNSAVYTWLAVHVCLAIFILVVGYKIIRATAAERQGRYLYSLFDMHSSWEVFNSKHASEFIGQSVGHIYNYGLLHHQLRYWIVSVTIMIWCIGLVCYPVLSQFMCMYYNAYIWAISAIYISGVPAAAALLSIFLIFLLFFFCQAFQAFPLNLTTILASYDRESITKQKQKKQQQQQQLAVLSEEDGRSYQPTRSSMSPENHDDESLHYDKHHHEISWQENLKLSAIWILLLLGNLVVVSSVNMGYVAFSHSNAASATSKSMVSFVVSIFKLVWSRVTMIVFENSLNTAANETNWVGFAIFMTWISLFNNIVAPMLAIAIYSKDCFFFAFFGAADITSEIKVYQTDVTISAVDEVSLNDPSVIHFSVEPVNLFSTFSPSFAYSYGCTAALLSSFVAVFIFRFVLTGAVMPALQIFLKVAQEYTLKHRGKDSKITKVLTTAVQLIVPLPLQLLSSHTEAIFDEHAQVLGIYDDFVASITDVAIFLTFGTIFPPLALVGCLGFILRTIFNQLIMGQVINRSRHQDNLKAFVKQMNKECQDIFLLWKRSIFTVAFLLSFTWGVLTFDTLGDAVGTVRGSWTLPFCILTTGIVQIYNIVQERYFPDAFLFGEIKNPFYFDEDSTGTFGKVMELSNLVSQQVSQQVQSVQQQVQSSIIIPLANVTVVNPLLRSDSTASSTSSSLPDMLRNLSHASFLSKGVANESQNGSDGKSSPQDDIGATGNFSPVALSAEEASAEPGSPYSEIYDK